MNLSSSSESSGSNDFKVVILWNGLQMDSSPGIVSSESNLSLSNSSSQIPSSLTSEESSSEWTSTQIILSVVLTLLCLLTTGSNSVVLYLFHKSKKALRSPSHILLANLAFSDLLVGILVMPILGTVTVADKYQWHFGPFMCSVSEYTHFSLCALSMMSMTGVAFERYIGVRFPLKHRFIMTKKRVHKMIGVLWGLAIALTGIPLSIWPDENFAPVVICSVNGNRSFLFFISFAVYWMPIVLTIILYTTVFIYAQRPLQMSSLIRKDTKNVPNSSGNKSGQPLNLKSLEGTNGKKFLAAKLRQTNLSKKLGLVLIIMLLMFGPVFGMFLLKAFDSPVYSFKLLLIAAWIRYANSCVNPFLFALAVPGYKKEFYKVFLNSRGDNRNNDISLNTSEAVSESCEWDDDKEDEDDSDEEMGKEESIIMDRSNNDYLEQGGSLIVPMTEQTTSKELVPSPSSFGSPIVHRFCTYCGVQMNREQNPPGKKQPCYCISCFEKFASGSGQVIFTEEAISFEKMGSGSGMDCDLMNSLGGVSDVSKSVRDSAIALRSRDGIDDTLMFEIQRFLKFMNEMMSRNNDNNAIFDVSASNDDKSSSNKRNTQKRQSDLLKVLHDHSSNFKSQRGLKDNDSSCRKQLDHFRKSIMSPIIKRRTKLLQNKSYGEIDWNSIEELDEIIVKLNNAMDRVPYKNSI